jgi:hypothetical protein
MDATKLRDEIFQALWGSQVETREQAEVKTSEILRLVDLYIGSRNNKKEVSNAVFSSSMDKG